MLCAVSYHPPQDSDNRRYNIIKLFLYTPANPANLYLQACTAVKPAAEVAQPVAVALPHQKAPQGAQVAKQVRTAHNMRWLK